MRDLAEARAVVAAARRLGRPVTLVNEPGAHAWLGPGYLLEMVRQAGADGRDAVAALDCGEDAGFAMLALRVGWRDLHLAGNADAVVRVSAMTGRAGGRFHAVLPDALTLAPGESADEALARWLVP